MLLAMRHIDRSAMGVLLSSATEAFGQRTRMAELLGFEHLQENAFDNVCANDGYIAVYSALQSVGLTLGGLVRDMEGYLSAVNLADEAYFTAIRDTHARCIDTVDKASSVIRSMAGNILGGLATPNDTVQGGTWQIAGLEIFEPALRAIKRFSTLIQTVAQAGPGNRGFEGQDQAEREAVLSSMRRQTGAIANRVQRADHVLALAVDGFVALKERATS